jgi:nucleoside-diphosphate-sugar epimerase
MKKLGIIGFGWLGSRIADILKEKYEIYSTTTSAEKCLDLKKQGWNIEVAVFSDDTIDTSLHQADFIKDMDAVMITVPFSERRHSPEAMKNRAANIAKYIGDFDKPVFMMSSTGIYPEISKIMTEDEVRSEDLISEGAFKNYFPQINILRLGGLMGDNRLLKNYGIKDPENLVNHIHYEDIAKVVEVMIEKKLTHKLYNLVAPLHPTKQEIIDVQTGNSTDKNNNTEKKGKEISPQKLIDDLDYEFLRPDPKYFHN